ncbi:unnamed protein product [Rhizophagus irregularis]|nr:unnamed protein product [Rhizophagus irregularis]
MIPICNKRKFSTIGAPPKPSAKPRKPSRILSSLENNESFLNKEQQNVLENKFVHIRKMLKTKPIWNYSHTKISQRKMFFQQFSRTVNLQLSSIFE